VFGFVFAAAVVCLDPVLVWLIVYIRDCGERGKENLIGKIRGKGFY